MKSLDQKVVVITGAGSGIGRALAIATAKKGAVLALADLNEEGVKETLSMAGASRSMARKLDVRSEEGFVAFARDVEKELGGAHVVVNNAGVSLSDTIGSMKRSDFEWLIDINFWGVVRGTEAFLPQLLARDDAHVVNISSVFGLISVPSQSAYNASKFAVRGYTESLRQELEEAGSNVHVTCVHPGGVKTNIVRNGRHMKNQFGKATDTATVSRTFDKAARTTPEKAAQIILAGVMSNAPRVLVGPDAHVIDVVQRIFPAGYPRALRTVGRWIEKSIERSVGKGAGKSGRTELDDEQEPLGEEGGGADPRPEHAAPRRGPPLSHEAEDEPHRDRRKSEEDGGALQGLHGQRANPLPRDGHAAHHR